jgi:hypothetical protein
MGQITLILPNLFAAQSLLFVPADHQPPIQTGKLLRNIESIYLAEYCHGA